MADIDPNDPNDPNDPYEIAYQLASKTLTIDQLTDEQRQSIASEAGVNDEDVSLNTAYTLLARYAETPIVKGQSIQVHHLLRAYDEMVFYLEKMGFERTLIDLPDVSTTRTSDVARDKWSALDRQIERIIGLRYVQRTLSTEMERQRFKGQLEALALNHPVTL